MGLLGLRRTRNSVRWVLPAGDVVSVQLGSWLAARTMMWLPDVGGIAAYEQRIALAAIPLWLAALAAAGAYRSAYFNAGSDALRRFLIGTVGGVLSVTFLAFVVNLPISRLFVGVLAAVAIVLGLAGRLLFRAFLLRSYRKSRLIERTLVIGRDDYAVDLVRLMSEGSGIPYLAVGMLWMDGVNGDRPTGLGVPILDLTSNLSESCERLEVDVVLVASGGLDPTGMRELFVALEDTPPRVVVAPSLFPLLPWRMTVETITGLPLVHVSEVRLSGWRAASKRLLDLAGASVLVVLLGPVLIVAMLAVLVADGRPVLFRQVRIGRQGRPFVLMKVRSMVREAESQLASLEGLNEAGGHFFKLSDDPRITRIGRFLRRWSIDEIPQLWSVLKGDMSLVGPRPLFSAPEDYDPIERRRLRVRPGLTGPWQVSGRSTVGGEEAVQKDLFYLENWTLLGDLIILGRTITTVLSRRGAA
jgi:exopolysaccharide biosynthesis polyprenyl glycosylphosphotransferase